jgi:hypothetical protein
MSSRLTFFDAIARGQRPAGAFLVPWLEDLAPRLEGRSHAELTADPTLWTNSLERLTKLVEADATAIGWDPSLLAAACGAPPRGEDDRSPSAVTMPAADAAAARSGRVPAFLETVRRLCATGRTERGCVVGVAGPAALAARLFGSAADGTSLTALKKILVEIVEAICQARPDALVLLETGAVTQDAAPSSELRRVYATLKNVAEHYGVAAAVCVEGFETIGAAAEWIAALRIDHWMLGADRQGRAPVAADAVAAARGRRSLALPLPLDDVKTARASAEAALAASAASDSAALYFTTAGPVPRQTDVAILRQAIAAVRELSRPRGS